MKDTTKAISRHFRQRQAGVRVSRAAIRDDSGQALIELAIGMTVLATLLLGAVEFGRLAYAGIEVSNAAHAGVQYGAQSHITSNDPPGMVLAAKQDAPNVPNLNATVSQFCTNCSSSQPIDYVQVNTTATIDPLFYVPGLPRSYTLTGQAVMQVEQ